MLWDSPFFNQLIEFWQSVSPGPYNIFMHVSLVLPLDSESALSWLYKLVKNVSLILAEVLNKVEVHYNRVIEATKLCQETVFPVGFWPFDLCELV